MDEVISVIVPIYNSEQYLRRCIDSLLDQNYDQLEIILVDDGSTDLSGKICEEFAERDKRIVYIHQNNGGSVKARKTGINKAKGKYIGFVDSDDYVEPEFILRLHELLIRENVDFVHSGFYIDEEYCGKKHSKRVELSDDNRLEKICNTVFSEEDKERITPSIWSKLFKADLCKEGFECIPEEASYGEDLIFLCYCLLNVNAYYICDEGYYHYTIIDDSLSHKIDRFQLKKEIILYNALVKLFEKDVGNKTMDDTMNRFLIEHTLMGLNQHPRLHNLIPSYIFPDIKIFFGKRLVLYGSGKVGNDYYMQIRRYSKCQLIAWVDKNAVNIKNEFYEINEPEYVTGLSYDYIIIAIKSTVKKEEILDQLIRLNIDKEKIIWEEPKRVYL